MQQKKFITNTTLVWYTSKIQMLSTEYLSWLFRSSWQLQDEITLPTNELSGGLQYHSKAHMRVTQSSLNVCLMIVYSHYYVAGNTKVWAINMTLRLPGLCNSSGICYTYNDAMIWRHFLFYWPFERGIPRFSGIHRSPGWLPSQKPVMCNFDDFFIVSINCLTNSRVANYLRRNDEHVMPP